jgi:RNA polymerase sigma-70 factor, ECF subfamily
MEVFLLHHPSIARVFFAIELYPYSYSYHVIVTPWYNMYGGKKRNEVFMTDLPNNGELIEALQGGDLNALGILYDRHKEMVYRTALVITGDTEAAADLLHDVFLRLNRFADLVDISRPLEPWLYRMTVNQANTWVKRSKRWLRSIEDVTDWLVGTKKIANPQPLPIDEEWQQVQQAVSSLAMPHRVVVVLYYLNDLSLQEISEILNVPVGTVKSRLHYGREALKKALLSHPNGPLSDLQCEFT